jgi:hypothetical protein
MNNLDKKYIIDGIAINKVEQGYSVFTIPTQHFHIVDLDELTNDRFDYEIKRQEQYDKESSELINLFLNEDEQTR